MFVVIVIVYNVLEQLVCRKADNNRITNSIPDEITAIHMVLRSTLHEARTQHVSLLGYNSHHFRTAM